MRLSRYEVAVLRAAGDVLLPHGGTPREAASEVGTAEAVAGLLEQRFAPAVARAVRVLLWLFELWPLPRHGRTFTRLGPHARARVLEEAAASRWLLRSAQVTLLKHLVVNTYLSDPGVGAQIGYRRPDPLVSGFHPPGPALAPLTWPDLPARGRLRCDVVVVGSGAGGATVAAELATAGLDVLVVEEGGYHTREQFQREPVWHRFLDLYRDQGTTMALGRPPIPVPVGCAVGGTTVVNAGTSLRAPDAVLDGWASAYGLEDARAADLASLYAEVEAVQSVHPAPEALLGANAEVFRRGVRALGHDGVPLGRSIVDCRGSGECVFGCPTDAKQAVHLTWLPRAERAGARILARVRVDRVLHERGRVTGVTATVLDPGRHDVPRGRLRIDAATVVVAAGALHTPILLDASGVPDPSGRRGRNLRVHPAVGLGAEMPGEVRAWRGTLQSWLVDALTEDPGIAIEVTASPPPLSGAQLPGTGALLKEVLAALPNLATSGFLVTDTSEGRVRRGPTGRPLVTYRLGETDRRRIKRGLGFLTEAFLAAGARRVLVGLPGQLWAASTSELQVLRDGRIPTRALKLSAYHPVGTHHLAADPARGPADPWGKVHGTAGLWVADASVFPTCLGVNPQLTIMAFALRTARAILAGQPATGQRAQGQVAV